jgi:hypothetical protein
MFQMPNDHSALRALLRLKAGLTPLERVGDLTINMARHEKYLRDLFDKADASERAFGMVLGPYGAGKSHFLQLAKDYALAHNFAVAQLAQATGVGSLSHPQRHLSTILSSLTAPAPRGPLLEWLGTYADDPTNCRLLEKHLILRTDEYREVSQVVDDVLAVLRSDPAHLRSAKLVEYLSGASLVGYSAHTNARIRAYRLFQFWIKFSTNYLNCGGLLLLLDEMENLFSGAVSWNILSRRTAYRSLAYYLTNLKPAIIVCALTPNGWEHMLSEIKEKRDFFTNYWSRLETENIPNLLATVLKTEPHELSIFNNASYRLLGDRLKNLHAEARDYSVGLLDSESYAPTISPGITPRIFAKSVVSMLEGLWFTSI